MNSLALVQDSRAVPAALPFCRARHDKSLADDLYPQLLDAILEQRISASSRFTEDSLGQMFGTGRGQVRRVLTRLSHEQIVVLRPNHRPQIAPLAAEQTRQVLQARRLTETTLIQLACQRAHPFALNALHQLIHKQRQHSAAGQRGAAIRLSGEFHLQLANMAGNAPLAHFLGSLVPVTSLAIAQCEQQSALDHIAQAQTAIVEAMAQADVNAAVQRVTQHLTDLELWLLGSTT